jgi:hypothetical protein
MGPSGIVKAYDCSGNRLLQCPTPLKPTTLPKAGLWLQGIFVDIDVTEVGLADLSILVPFEHAVDGHAQLCRVRLSDAARIHPSIRETITNCLRAIFVKFVSPKSNLQLSPLQFMEQ